MHSDDAFTLSRQLSKRFEIGREHAEAMQQLAIRRVESAVGRASEDLRVDLKAYSRSLKDLSFESTGRVVSSIRELGNLPGAGLGEVRWAVERNTEASRDILQALLSSLPVESQRRFQQGVVAFECQEDEIARESFEKALEANKTNDFAYQYMGFLRIRAGLISEADRCFELAEKFATTPYHRGLARSHRARCKVTLGQAEEGSRLLEMALNEEPRVEWRFQLAVTQAQAGLQEEWEGTLRSAIEGRWLYWAAALENPDLLPVRTKVEDLLRSMKQEQREIAERRLEEARAPLAWVKRAGANLGTSLAQVSGEFEAGVKAATVFDYLEFQRLAEEGTRATCNELDRWANDQEHKLNQPASELRSRIEKIEKTYQPLLQGCWWWVSWSVVWVAELVLLKVYEDDLPRLLLGGPWRAHAFSATAILTAAIALAVYYGVNAWWRNRFFVRPLSDLRQRLRVAEIEARASIQQIQPWREKAFEWLRRNPE